MVLCVLRASSEQPCAVPLGHVQTASRAGVKCVFVDKVKRVTGVTVITGDGRSAQTAQQREAKQEAH